ncbi:MAG: hypothetical protein ACOX3T_08000 [Bdellovibrionota bacterium]
MDNNEFLTESQTLIYAGIDRNILTRFCETGYIKTKMLANGQVLYSKSEIERVFGKRREVLASYDAKQSVGQGSALKVGNLDVAYSDDYSSDDFSSDNYEDDIQSEKSANKQNINKQSANEKSAKSNTSRLIKFPEATRTNVSKEEQELSSKANKDFQGTNNRDNNKNNNNVYNDNAEMIAKVKEETSNQNSDAFNSNKTANYQYNNLHNNLQSNLHSNLHSGLQNFQGFNHNKNVNTSFSKPEQSYIEQVKKLSNDNGNLKQEIVKLQSYARLQKKLLEVKENEISELKQEKDWLKNRIESQEEKNNRDQLLILSETRVIHNLLANAQKTSPFRAALEWFGFTKKNRQETIDMVKQ